MEGNLSDALHAVSTMDIVEEFGIAHMSKKDKVYLLCPGHDDAHFGSCYIDKNDDGYYCYACSEHVRKWDMLKKVSGFTNAAAAEWFFHRAGITPSQTANPLTSIIKLIKRIEPFVDNSPVYDDKHLCPKSESSYGRIQNGEYFYSEIIYTNPLLELYKTSPTTFTQIVTNTLLVKEREYKNLAMFCRSHINEYTTNADGEPQKNTAYAELRKQCQARINEIEDIIDQVSKI